ncbi:MAG: hypothetical protein J5852_04730, partial [Clostridia bacterium]|nr:hypothetical protein [Clostridia bacterium]
MTRKILNPVTFATIIVIMYMTVPIVSIFISTYITTYAYMLLTAFLVVFIMLSGGVERLSAIIRITFPFLVFIACTLSKYTRADSLAVWGYQNMLFILPVILGLYYMYYRPENIKLFSVIIIVLFFVTIITTITGLIRFPNAARILATIASSDDTEAIKYWWHNIGGYDFIYSCVLLYPLLILCHKLRI